MSMEDLKIRDVGEDKPKMVDGDTIIYLTNTHSIGE